MKKKSKFLFTFFILILAFLPCNSFLALENQDLNSYTFKLQLDDNKKSLSGEEKVQFKNTYQTELSQIVFHLYADSFNKANTISTMGIQPSELTKEETGDIKIQSVLINNEPMKYTEDNQILKINLPSKLMPNEKVDITLNFDLKIPNSTHRFGYYNNQISLVNWYPILSIYDEKSKMWDENPFNLVGESNYSQCSNYDFNLKVPKNIVVASTGVTKTETVDDYWKTLNIQGTKVRDFVLMMNKDYKVISKTFNGVKINCYYISPKDDLSINSKSKNDEKINTAKKLLDYGCDALDFYSKTFGCYPYEEFDITESYLAGGAMEYPQIIDIGEYPNNYDEASFINESIVHETAHQWWYSLVGNNEFKEPMLDESFAEFSTHLYFEKKYGELSRFALKPTLYMGSSPNDLPINSSVDKFESWNNYGPTIYTKGATALEDLRKSIGDEKFFSILKEYFNNYEYKIASVDDLLDVIQKIAGKEIRDYFFTSINNNNFNPKYLNLTDAERQILSIMYFKINLEYNEKQYGTNLLSIFLKGLRGETIYIVKPSKSVKNNELLLSNLKSFENLLNHSKITYKVITDKQVTKSIEKKNLILLDEEGSNSYLTKVSSKLPVKITTKDISLNNITITNKDINGVFITKNPNKQNNLILVVLSGKTSDANITETSIIDDYYAYMEDFTYTGYILKINDRSIIKGNF